MDLVYFIKDRVVVQHYVECAGCGAILWFQVGRTLGEIRSAVGAEGWTVRGEKPQAFCGACSKDRGERANEPA